jgi:hypothetical protein
VVRPERYWNDHAASDPTRKPGGGEAQHALNLGHVIRSRLPDPHTQRGLSAAQTKVGAMTATGSVVATNRLRRDFRGSECRNIAR